MLVGGLVPYSLRMWTWPAIVTLLLFSLARGEVFTIEPLQVLVHGPQAWMYTGNLTGDFSSLINGTLWIEPTFDAQGALVNVRSWQTATISAFSADTLWLGLSYPFDAAHTASHYFQGLLPESPGGSCNNVGCSAFDEVLNCTSWTQQDVTTYFSNCSVVRTCGAGKGTMGWFATTVWVTVYGELVESFAQFTFTDPSTNKTSAGTQSMFLKPVPYVNVPTNPCF